MNDAAPAWDDRYTAVPNPNGDSDQHEWAQVKDKPLRNVWTVVEGDNGGLFAAAGFHVVNKLYYLLSEEEWQDEGECYPLDPDIDLTTERRVWVVVKDANGAPDLIAVTVDASDLHVETGEHYERAREKAREDGYEPIELADEADPMGKRLALAEDLHSALDDCRHQLSQLAGLVDDSDGAVKAALQGATEVMRRWKAINRPQNPSGQQGGPSP